MGVLANHVPSIEQLKPGLVEIIEEGGATKQYFRMSLTASLLNKNVDLSIFSVRWLCRRPARLSAEH